MEGGDRVGSFCRLKFRLGWAGRGELSVCLRHCVALILIFLFAVCAMNVLDGLAVDCGIAVISRVFTRFQPLSCDCLLTWLFDCLFDGFSDCLEFYVCAPVRLIV